mmetsp:Transcript_95910/g.310976  ORF Transcript_95910/g.310976 Transcript_95910/m.310976 type:complete len:422 (+) Transcript_95910:86-1351(+)
MDEQTGRSLVAMDEQTGRSLVAMDEQTASSTSLDQAQCWRRSCARFSASYLVCSNIDSCPISGGRIPVCEACSACCPKCGCTAFDLDSATSVLDPLGYSASQVSSEVRGDVDSSLAPFPLDVTNATGQERSSMQTYRKCDGCGCESQDGRKDHTKGHYCEWCWSNWNGRVPDYVHAVAAEHPRPEVLRYETTESIPAPVGREFLDTRVEVLRDDCLACAQQLAAGGGEPCVLAMCRKRNSSGWGGIASRGQLGELCRSTTYQVAVGEHCFPLAERSALYVSGVTVFRICQTDVPHFRVALVCAAALFFPSYSAEDRITYSDELHAKIAGVLRVCALNKHQHLVLGAWGCGWCQNPALEVAQAFRTALQGEFRGCFSHVVFAIRATDTSDKFITDEVFNAFHEEFEALGNPTANHSASHAHA